MYATAIRENMNVIDRQQRKAEIPGITCSPLIIHLSVKGTCMLCISPQVSWFACCDALEGRYFMIECAGDVDWAAVEVM